MRRLSGLYMLLCWLTLTGCAHVPDSWVISGGGKYGDAGHSIALDHKGDVYIAGFYSHAAKVGPFWLGEPYKPGGSFVAKLNPKGSFLWARTGAGGSGLVTSPSGEVYTIGSFQDTRYIGAETHHAKGMRDVLVSKWTSDGELVWSSAMGGSADDYGSGIALDSEDNVYIAGSFAGTATFGTFTRTSNSRALFIAKLDRHGAFIWFTTSRDGNFGTPKLSLDQNAQLYITGRFSGRAQLGTSWMGSADALGTSFVASLDSKGSFLWARAGIGGNDLKADARGVIVLGGITTKLDRSGRTVWELPFGGSVIAVDRRGAMYIAPSHSSTVVCDKRDVRGNLLRTYSGAAAAGIAVGKDGAVYATGTFLEPTDFDAFTLQSTGSYDLFIVRYPAL